MNLLALEKVVEEKPLQESRGREHLVGTDMKYGGSLLHVGD